MFGLIPFSEALVRFTTLIFALYFATFWFQGDLFGKAQLVVLWFAIEMLGQISDHNDIKVPFRFLRSSLLPIEFLVYCHSAKP